jgi:predicted ArsR family transcriptional regulator
MIRELLAHNDYVRVLNALERRPMRFGHLQNELKLHPPQVARALKFLSRAKLVAYRLADTAAGRPLFVYVLTDRGEAFQEAFRAFVLALNRRRTRLGADALVDMRKWWA